MATAKDNNDVLNNITNNVRSIVTKKLSTIIAMALNLDVNNLPDQVSSLASDLEKELYKNYTDKPSDYLNQLAILTIFMDPKHHIGQFAKLFRTKAYQGIYEPARIAKLDIADILPEVFLNPDTEQSAKLDIHQSIVKIIQDTSKQLERSILTSLNPYKKLKPEKKMYTKYAIDKKLKNSTVDVKDLCENPYWKMKKVNMIICKENKKFYCLDIQQLLGELAEKNTATNYFTGKKLNPEITSNLRKRFSAEIEEIKTTNNPVEIGGREVDELVDLENTLEKLRKFKTTLNQPDMLESVELFGIGMLEDPSVGGSKDILNSIPSMIQQEFDKYLTDSEYKTAIEQINMWLDQNITEIENILKPAEEPDTEESPEIDFGIAEESPEPYVDIAKQAEEKLIKDTVLVPGRVTKAVYDDYLQRLLAANKTVMEALKITGDITARQELNSRLYEINSQLKELRGNVRSIQGLIYLLQSAIKSQTARLETIKKPIGMQLLYPTDEYSKEEVHELEKFISNLQTEIGYLEQLKKSVQQNA